MGSSLGPVLFKRDRRHEINDQGMFADGRLEVESEMRMALG